MTTVGFLCFGVLVFVSCKQLVFILSDSDCVFNDNNLVTIVTGLVAISGDNNSLIGCPTSIRFHMTTIV